MKFLTDKQLKTEKGIQGSEVTVWRKRRDGKLPRARKFGSRLHGTPEPLIDAYLRAIAAGHSEEVATQIAEDRLAKLLASANAA